MDSEWLTTLFGYGFFSSIVCILGVISIGLIVGLIVVAVISYNRSKEQSVKDEALINRVVTTIPSDKQALFMMQYNSSKKNFTTAILLGLFLGGVGGHHFYLGNVGLGIVYLLFCWTYIPGFIAIYDLLVMSSRLSKYNLKKANEIAMYFGGQPVFM